MNLFRGLFPTTEPRRRSIYGRISRTNPENALCPTCEKINWANIFVGNPKRRRRAGRAIEMHEDDRHAPIPSFSEMRSNVNCPFCRLVLRAREITYKDWVPPKTFRDDQLVVAWFASKDGKPARIRGDNDDIELFRRAMRREFEFRITIAWAGHLAIETPMKIMASARDVENEWNYRTGVRLDRGRIDIGLFRRWLGYCEKAHLDCRDGKPFRGLENQKMFRVIDVETRMVVTAPPMCRYVTLSYVWGQGNIVKALAQNFRTTIGNDSRIQRLDLSETVLPKTISDAIFVTKLLNERYLWVDSLCIVQDDVEDLANNISYMDDIYRCSRVTIVGAAGDAQTGLPGLFRNSRDVHQVRERVNGIELIVPLPSLEERLKNSQWKTRAWTFQEEMLSRRRLIFVDGFAYFNCVEDCWSEDVFEGNDPKQHQKRWNDILGNSKHLQRKVEGSYGLTTTTLRIPNFGDPRTLDRLFYKYNMIVTEYTQRNLTCPSDILDAFEGVRKALESEMDTVFAFGLPQRYFNAALLWRDLRAWQSQDWWSKRDPRRRTYRGHSPDTVEELWRKQSEAPDDLVPGVGEGLKRRIPKKLQILPSWAWCAWEGGMGYPARDMEEQTSELVSDNSSDIIWPWKAKRDRRKLVSQLIRTGVLVFETSVAMVDVGKIRSPARWSMKWNTFVGWPVDNGGRVKEGEQECILLSRSVLRLDSWDFTPLNVMMVERDKNGICSRKGIGVIRDDDWASFSPKPQTIQLG